MDTLTHTIIAVGSLSASYYLGAYLKSRSVFEDIVGNTFDKLEKGGFIVTKLDKDAYTDGSVAVIMIFSSVPTSSFSGVPLNSPVPESKDAQDGLFAILNVNSSPISTSLPVGMNE